MARAYAEFKSLDITEFEIEQTAAHYTFSPSGEVLHGIYPSLQGSLFYESAYGYCIHVSKPITITQHNDRTNVHFKVNPTGVPESRLQLSDLSLHYIILH